LLWAWSCGFVLTDAAAAASGSSSAQTTTGSSPFLPPPPRPLYISVSRPVAFIPSLRAPSERCRRPMSNRPAIQLRSSSMLSLEAADRLTDRPAGRRPISADVNLVNEPALYTPLLRIARRLSVCPSVRLSRPSSPSLHKQKKNRREDRPRNSLATRSKVQVTYHLRGWRHLVKATEVTAGLAECNGSEPPSLWRDSLHVTCSRC